MFVLVMDKLVSLGVSELLEIRSRIAQLIVKKLRCRPVCMYLVYDVGTCNILADYQNGGRSNSKVQTMGSPVRIGIPLICNSAFGESERKVRMKSSTSSL